MKEYEFVNITSNCEEKYEATPNHSMILTTATSKTAAQSSRKPILELFKACYLTIVRSSSVKNFIRSCNLEGFKTKYCNSTNKNYRYCKAYLGKVLNYANFHCYKCNTNNSGIHSIAPCLAPVPPVVYMNSWSFTISFTGNTHIKIKDSVGTSSNYNDYCRKGETYDMLLGKCVKFSCAYNYEAVGSKCIRRAI